MDLLGDALNYKPVDQFVVIQFPKALGAGSKDCRHRSGDY